MCIIVKDNVNVNMGFIVVPLPKWLHRSDFVSNSIQKTVYPRVFAARVKV